MDEASGSVRRNIILHCIINIFSVQKLRISEVDDKNCSMESTHDRKKSLQAQCESASGGEQRRQRRWDTKPFK